MDRPVAPTVEQQTPNLRDGGSNPSWPANRSIAEMKLIKADVAKHIVDSLKK